MSDARRFPPPWTVEELDAITANQPMTAEQAATLKRLAEAAHELEAFQPNLRRAEAALRIAMLTAKLKLLDGPPHTLWEARAPTPLPAAVVCRTANCDYTTSVIVITDRNRNFGQNDFVKHRGIRYAIKIGIAREQWRVAILIPGKRLPEERKVSGTRQDAETAARSMINAWLKKRPEPEKG
jgi:hypothetical protein